MDRNKLGLDDSLIEATRAIVEKNLHQNQEKLDKQLDEMKHMGSYTQSHVMKKIKSGDWEATTDVKPNRYVELRHHSGKRITVKVEHDPVKEDVELVEGKKNLHQNQEKLDKQLDEATVDTNKYSWGTMKVVHHGSSFSIPLHPEHHQAIAKLKDRDEHFFKDETGSRWKAKRVGDVVHFTGNSYSNEGYKTKVPFKSLTESGTPQNIAANKFLKRSAGIRKAVDKLTKEQLEEIEALAAKHGLTGE